MAYQLICRIISSERILITRHWNNRTRNYVRDIKSKKIVETKSQKLETIDCLENIIEITLASETYNVSVEREKPLECLLESALNNKWFGDNDH